MKHAGRRLRRRSAVLVTACFVLAGGVLTAAYAIVPPAATPTTQVARVPHAGSGKSTPPIPKGPGWTALGLIIDKTVQSVKKAKITFNVPEVTALAYTLVHNEVPIDPKYAWLDAVAESYVTSPKGSSDAFGIFPTVRVKMVAFGSIPVSARVHITQVKEKGKLVPLELNLRFSGKPVDPAPALPCATPQNTCQYTEQPTITGPVDIRVDDIEVDGVPVNTGSDCHTAEPAQLSLKADAGYYSTSPSNIYAPPGLYLPFYNGGILHGPVDVPEFSGCHNGGDDLDPLLNAMVSGPGNELAIHQDGPLQEYPPKPTK